MKSLKGFWQRHFSLVWLLSTTPAWPAELLRVGYLDEQAVSAGTAEAVEFGDFSRAAAKQIGEDRANLRKLAQHYNQAKNPSQAEKNAILEATGDYQQEQRRLRDALNKLLSRRRSKLLPVLETLSVQKKLPIVIASESIFYIDHDHTSLIDLTEELKLQLKSTSVSKPEQHSN